MNQMKIKWGSNRMLKMKIGYSKRMNLKSKRISIILIAISVNKLVRKSASERILLRLHGTRIHLFPSLIRRTQFSKRKGAENLTLKRLLSTNSWMKKIRFPINSPASKSVLVNLMAIILLQTMKILLMARSTTLKSTIITSMRDFSKRSKKSLLQKIPKLNLQLGILMKI